MNSMFMCDVSFVCFSLCSWAAGRNSYKSGAMEKASRTVVAVAVAVRWRGEGGHCFVLLHQAPAEHPAITQPRYYGVREGL
jgi:hypothetical protein